MTESKLCEFDAISLFNNHDLDAERQRELAAHLESCEICRNAVEKTAAEQGFWDEIVEHLGEKQRSRLLSKSVDDETVDANHRPDRTPHESGFQNRHALTTDPSVKSLIDLLSPTDDPEMLGRIGEYEIAAIVGIGGMGAVFKGFDRSLMRVVAIKVMAPSLANKGSARKRFEREARAAAAISHNNVIDIYRVDEFNGLPYLVTPFARGASLQKRLDDSGPLSTMEVVLVGKQIASGLAAAHEQGLVHRDIKPANILLNDCVERILITDFGVARAMDDVAVTQTGLIAGTPQYMSPEQARGEFVDQRSDLFSLGSLLYTACTGRPPFRSETPFGILRRITDSQPRSILEINPEIPQWLVMIIANLLEKDASLRFQSAGEVAALFDQCLAHLRQPNQIQLPQAIFDLPPGQAISVPKPKKAVEKRRFAWLKIALSLAGVTLLAALGFLKWSDPPNIAGVWAGESWKEIHLNSVEEADDWYAGSFVDAAGNDGAIHLEWSRLEQRFTGRWSVDSQTSGTIVLRQGRHGGVKGAIMLDSESVPSSDQKRLRDFAWQATDGDRKKSNVTAYTKPHASGTTGYTEPQSSTNVFAPGSGRVTKFNSKIKTGAQVNAGDLILEFEPLEKTLTQTDLEGTNKRIRECELRKKAFENRLELAKRTLDANVGRSRGNAETEKIGFEASKRQLEGYETSLKISQANVERNKKLHEKGLASDKILEAAQAELAAKRSEIEGALAATDVLRNKWQMAKQEVEIVELEHLQIINEIKIAKEANDAKLAELLRDKQILEKDLSNKKDIRVIAPVSGVVQLMAGRPVEEVYENGVILTIRSSPDSKESQPDDATVESVQSGKTAGERHGKTKTSMDVAKQREAEIYMLINNYKAVRKSQAAEGERLQEELAHQQKAAEISIAIANEKATAAKAHYEAKSIALKGLKAVVSQVKQEHELAEKKSHTGSVPQSEVAAKKTKLETAQADLAAAIGEVEQLKSTWKLKALEVSQVREQTQAEQSNTKFKLAIARKEAERANEKLAALEKELKAIKATPATGAD